MIKMDFTLQAILIILAVTFVCFVLLITKKQKLAYKFTLMWLMFSFAILIIALFPQIIMAISKWIHIETPVNALFLMILGAMILIIFFITIGYSKHNEKLTRLIQANAILENRIRQLEKSRRQDNDNN